MASPPAPVYEDIIEDGFYDEIKKDPSLLERLLEFYKPYRNILV
ncbi:unnamed protein product, partial [marine sediment metagenome]